MAERMGHMKGAFGRAGLVFAIWGIVFLAVIQLDPSASSVPGWFPAIVMGIGTWLWVSLGGDDE